MKPFLIKILIPVAFIGFFMGCETKTDNKITVESKSNLEHVNPNIGAVGYLLHPMRPNVQLPNQPIRMHPFR